MSGRGSQETIKRKELVARLNETCQRAFFSASNAAKARGNPYVELVHFITALIDAEASDFRLMLDASGVDQHKLQGDLLRMLDGLPSGAGSVEEFSDHIFRAVQEAWSYGSLNHGTEQVRSAYILLACLDSSTLEALLAKCSDEFSKLAVSSLTAELETVLQRSEESASDEAQTTTPGGSTGPLEKYATDLTARARDGKIDPVIGRDPEIRQIIDILMRRRQNNPILTGEAGVGKTAVVEGFAQRLAKGDVPPQLQNVALWMLDIGLMQAGASMKGEFEKRLKSVIDAVQSSATPIILFIDEAHTLIGAGGAAGTGDAANLLKPALARGELRTVAATTWAEYKQHIEPDPALTRRFQPVAVDEPEESVAVRMCRGVASVLEQHHVVEVLDEAIEAAVSLSHRYIPARQLPDKAISLLDTACARVAVSQHATPAAVEDLDRRAAYLEVELRIARREAEIGIDAADRIAAAEQALKAVSADMDVAQQRWEAERALVDQILYLRAQLRANRAPQDEAAEAGGILSHDDRSTLLAALKDAMATLAETQGEAPLILPSVDRNAVATVVQDWTGIPTGRMMTSQTERALNLASILSERVVGQDHAMTAISSRIQTAAAGLNAPEKPMGVFMLCGPSGVGKTETALALAETLFGGEQNLISINMSEFQEAHTVSTLKGAPPGYVGYGKGGILTEAVRRKPYSVVLLDEVEKAHPDVHEIFFQVFDKGMMDDSEGRRIDFKNTLILLTSNVGSEQIMALTDGGTRDAEDKVLNGALRDPLLSVFPAALLGRIVTIPFYPLSDGMIEVISRLKIRSIAKRLIAGYDATLIVEDSAIETIKRRCTEIESGGRMIDAILTNTMLPELSRELLNRQIDGVALREVRVSGNAAGFHYEFS